MNFPGSINLEGLLSMLFSDLHPKTVVITTAIYKIDFFIYRSNESLCPLVPSITFPLFQTTFPLTIVVSICELNS